MTAKTVREVIEQLSKLDPELPMFFDCPFCGRANLFSTAKKCAVIETDPKS
jgi:transcription elongation factor Elf1